MKSNIYAVIMAGGSGERFWPVSRSKTPKQLLAVIGNKTMLQEAVSKVLKLTRKENIYVITNKEHAGEAKRQLPVLNAKNIIAEPMGRDTAPCIALAAAIISKRDPNAVMVVMPADHIIKDNEKFLTILKNAAQICMDHPYLVTIGIKPHTPHTGYGYLRFGIKLGIATETTFRKVDKFEEKPNIETARQFIADGNYFWNSGIFIWSVSTILAEFEKSMPRLYDSIIKIQPAVGTKDFAGCLEKIYGKLEKISIDYGVMEKSANVISAEADFYWDDLGSWASLEKYFEKDISGNISQGEVQLCDVKNSLVVSKDGLVAVIGADNLVIVKTKDVVLVADKSKLEDMKKLVKSLKSNKKLIRYT